MNLSKKLIFKPAQIAEARSPVELELPSQYRGFAPIEKGAMAAPEGSEVDLAEEYRGPTIEEIEKELEEYRKQQLEKIEEELSRAHEQARQIEEDGKTAAFNLMQEAKEKSKQELEGSRLETEQMFERAKLEVERMVKNADMKVAETEHGAYQKGYNDGRDSGYQEGQKEVQHLIDRLGVIIGQAIDAREELIRSSEKQVVEIILMIARKIIKDEVVERRKEVVLKEVVLNNVRDALQRLRDQEEVTIRVNLADFQLTTEHKKEFIEKVESLRKINLFQDARVDPGGCIIEIDAGSVDARISTQLRQIEEAVRSFEPSG